MFNGWINKDHLETDQLKKQFLNNKPFPHLELKNFFNKEKLLKVMESLSKEEFYIKNSDLFTFFQTYDFKSTKNKIIKEFHDFLNSSEFKNYISKITNRQLQLEIDCFGTIYQDTNYLLPHDDRLDTRQIAYVIYFSNLNKFDGGSLDFYSTRNGQPSTLSKSLIPKFNTFAFFEVSPKSFHQVSEVTSVKQRISITGWFS